MPAITKPTLTINVTMDDNVQNGLRPDGTLASTVYGSPTSTGSTRSPTSTIATSIDEGSVPASPVVIASPPTFVIVNGKKYETGKLRIMADQIAKARETGELPASKASLEDGDIIVEDYNSLMQLKAVRGDPTTKPSQEYIALRVDIARRTKDRDDDLDDDAVRAVAAKRIANFKRVASQEDRFLAIINHVTRKQNPGNPSQVDMDETMDEVINIIEHSLMSATGPIRLNANRMGNTADSLDTSVNTLDTTANHLNSSMNVLNSSMSVLNSSVNVVGAQINGLTANVQNIGSLIRILELIVQRNGDRFEGGLQNMTTVLTGMQAIVNSLPAIVGEIVQDSVRAEVAPIIREIMMAQVQAAIASSLANAGKNETNAPANKNSSAKGFFKKLFKRGHSA